MLLLIHDLHHVLNQYRTGACKLRKVRLTAVDLQTQLLSRMRAYPNRKLAEADFLRQHRRLIELYTQALHAIDLGLANILAEVIEQQDQLFRDLIPADEPLPAFHLEKLRSEIQRQLPALMEKLAKKGIPQSQLNEIAHAVDALLTEGKVPIPCYHHQKYLPDFLNMLWQLANDTRRKDWAKRFTEILVRANFNYMGYVNRWKEGLQEEIEKALFQGKAEQVLKALKASIKLYPEPCPGFDLSRPSLGAMMNVCVEHGMNTLLDQHTYDHPLRTELFGSDLAVRFHYRYKAGELAYSTQKDAAIDYARVHLSQQAQLVSPHSLTKFDKQSLYPAAARYKKQLIYELKMLEKDFQLE